MTINKTGHETNGLSDKAGVILLVNTFFQGKLSSNISKEVRQKFRRCSKILPTIYRSWINHYLSYGINVWGQSTKTNFKEAVIIYHRRGRAAEHSQEGGGVIRYRQSIKGGNLENLQPNEDQ